jgi:hypothetical protein
VSADGFDAINADDMLVLQRDSRAGLADEPFGAEAVGVSGQIRKP